MGTKYIGKKIDFSTTYALQKNGDFIQGLYFDSQLGEVRPTVVFDAKGIEIFGKYKLNKLSILAGYNHYAPIVDHIPIISGQSPIYGGFKRNDYIAGISYQPIKFVQLYSEQRISTGKNAIGEREQSVFTMGMKIDIAKSFG